PPASTASSPASTCPNQALVECFARNEQNVSRPPRSSALGLDTRCSLRSRRTRPAVHLGLTDACSRRLLHPHRGAVATHDRYGLRPRLFADYRAAARLKRRRLRRAGLQRRRLA